MDFPRNVLFPEEFPGFSSFPGFPVKLMDFPRNVLFPKPLVSALSLVFLLN
jgi:hypothetical protein